jgi:uncharacterized protein YhaN
MKFQQLRLIAYGPFSNRTLNFSGGEANLHVIYGPNEAGKSSSLRAITDFLYGIPSRTADDFVHPYSKLRIGAILERSDNATLHAMRRKANQNSLRCAQDVEVVDESQLSHFTGNLNKELFLTLYGLNHERLRIGGEAIVRGTGHIGALLFASAAGLSDLRPLQSRLADETDQLMTSTGRAGVIVEKIKQWKDLQAEAKELQLSVEEWNQVAEEVKNYEKEKLELESLIADRTSLLNRLQRITSAIPIATKLIAAKQELDQVSSAPDLPEDFVSQVHELQTNRNLQSLACKQTEDRLAQLEKEIEGISISEQILAAKLTISALRAKYGFILKSKEDIPKRVADRDTSLSKCREILQRLGYSTDMSDVETLFLTDSERVRILELGREKSKVDAEELNARKNYERIQAELIHLNEAIDTKDLRIDTIQLEEAIDASQREGDLDSKLVSIQDEVTQLESNVRTQLKLLAPWKGTLDEFDEMSCPSQAIIQDFQKKFVEMGQKGEVIQNQIRQLQESLDDDQWALTELERDREVFTLEVLHKSREERQALWEHIVEDWRNGGRSQDKNQNEWKQLGLFQGNGGTLQGAYEESVKRADAIADGMRENADVVAKKMAFQSAVVRKKKLIETQLGYLATNNLDLEVLTVSWRELWKPLAIEPKQPTEMVAWRSQVEVVRGIAQQLKLKRIEVAILQDRIQNYIVNLHQVMDTMPFPSQNSVESVVTISSGLQKVTLQGLIKVAKRKLSDLQREQNQRTHKISSRDNALVELEAAEQSLKASQLELDSWRIAWAHQMKRLNLDAAASPVQAESVLLNLQQLFVEHSKAKDLNTRIEKMSIDINGFESELVEIVNRLAPGLMGRSSEEMVSMLDGLREKNEFDQKRLIEKRSELIAKRESLVRDKETLSQIDARLSTLCEQAGCVDVSRLLEIGKLSDSKRSLIARVFDFEEQLIQFSGGLNSEQFLAEIGVERERVDQLPYTIQDLSSELHQLSEKRDRALGDIRESKAKLSRWNGGGGAAEKQAQCESAATELADLTKRLAVLRMGTVLLNTAMETHRKKNQAPVLARASELFCKLTCEGFSGLQTDFDDQGPLLVAERSTGERLPLAGLSEGTADQLYLSLRIASLEEWLKRHEPVPFIIDDILITFDDKRCAAALEVLSELSSRTQVLFFTHHQHIVEMARATLGNKVMATHSLSN